MTAPERPATPADPWPLLRSLTTARVGLGRAGVSLPTRPQLAFQLAHAQARDAVQGELDMVWLRRELAARGREAIVLHSAAPDRRTYLQRPDLGRKLEPASAARLAECAAARAGDYDVAFIVADGLSALAVQRHAVALLEETLPALEAEGWRTAPLVLVRHGRVAISDEVGALLRAEQAVILIGERPGLSSPDSLGVYLTYGPRVGNTDAGRNCISNIREAGLSYAEAAHTLLYLLREARRRKLSGVALKDESQPLPNAGRLAQKRNFLVAEG